VRLSAGARLAPIATLGVLAALACSPPPEKAPSIERRLETVEVAAAPDAEASLEGDRLEPRVASGRAAIAGVLPEGFPSDVPLPRPSSLVDFGPRSVTLEVDGGREGVRSAYLEQLAAAGFVARDGGRWQRANRSLRVDFAARAGATRVTIEIVPGP